MKKATYLERLARYGINSSHPGGLVLTREILRHEKITTDMTVLDIGCGTGQTSMYIRTHYPCKVIAADINAEMLERAKKNFESHHLDIPLRRVNAMDMPFLDNSFDMIISESVSVFTNIRKTLREYYRVLKKGGVLLEIEGTALQPLNFPEAEDFKRVLGIEHLPTREEWNKIFKEAGFSDIRVLCFQRMNWVGTGSPSINRAFQDYINIMNRYREKLRYGVYRCVV